MKKPAIFRIAVMTFLLWLALGHGDALAQINSSGIMDEAYDRYRAASRNWAAIITRHAEWLFWVLATISMVWTFGMMALRKADIGEFFAEFIRFTVFTGFFLWLLQNGPVFANDIFVSLSTIGGQAAGAVVNSERNPTPSGIVDVGFAIFSRVLEQSSIWSPLDAALCIVISIFVLLVLTLIGLNMLLLLISGWVLAYAGIFFLGFGGSRWTSDMAINYFKTVLSVAAQLFTMVLLVGVGRTFIESYANKLNGGISLEELVVMLVVVVVLLALVNKVPPLVGGLAMGGGTGSLGGGVGGRDALAAAQRTFKGSSKERGPQAVMAASSKANASESGGGGGAADLMGRAGGVGDAGGGGSGGGALASAMGDSGGGSGGTSSGFTSGGSSFGSSFSSGAGSGSGRSSSSSASSNIATASSNKGGAQGGGRSSMQNTSANANPYAAQAADRANANPYADQSSASAETNPFSGQAGGSASTNPYADQAGSAGGGAPGEVKSSSALASAVKAGRAAAGTVSNLMQGALDAAKGSVKDGVARTSGGTIASAINASRAVSGSDANNGAAFDGNSLATGADKSSDFNPEVSAFVNRDSTTT